MLAAAAVSAFNPLLDKARRLLDGIAVATAAGVTGILLAILVSTGGHGPERVDWFAGFRPHNGVAIGIDFAVGPLNAGIAALSALLAPPPWSSRGATSNRCRLLLRPHARVLGRHGDVTNNRLLSLGRYSCPPAWTTSATSPRPITEASERLQTTSNDKASSS